MSYVPYNGVLILKSRRLNSQGEACGWDYIYRNQDVFRLCGVTQGQPQP